MEPPREASDLKKREDGLDDFVRAAWPCCDEAVFMCTYRCCLTLALVASIAVDVIHHPRSTEMSAWLWLLYVTNWSLMAYTASQATLAVVTILAHFRPTDRLRRLAFILEPVYTMAATMMIGSGLFYFMMIKWTNYGIVEHGAMIAVVALDLWITPVPYHFTQVIWPILFALSYIVVSTIHQHLSTCRIYHAYNWEKPRTAFLVCLAALALTILTHIYLVLLCKLRNYLAMSKKSSELRRDQ